MLVALRILTRSTTTARQSNFDQSDPAAGRADHDNHDKARSIRYSSDPVLVRDLEVVIRKDSHRSGPFTRHEFGSCCERPVDAPGKVILVRQVFPKTAYAPPVIDVAERKPRSHVYAMRNAESGIIVERSAEHRVGKAYVSMCSSRWLPQH